MPSAGMDTRMRRYDTWEVMADLIWSEGAPSPAMDTRMRGYDSGCAGMT